MTDGEGEKWATELLGDKRRCRCGAHVNTKFYRVFADNDGEIRKCPACATQAEYSRQKGGRR